MPKDEAYQQAEQKIAEALKTGATELDLRTMKLTELPESIGQLKQLRKLDIGHDWKKDDKDKNQLTALPDSLGQLTQLTSLDLSDNQLTALPDSLAQAQLTQLTELNLSNNQLTALPDSLGQLTQLTKLDLSENQLTALPDSLGQLTQLTNLDLSSNQLTTLPDSLGQLTQLQTLDINSNLLKYLPESLGNLEKMNLLSVYDTEIKVLPESFANFSELEGLLIGNLDGETFGELPKVITHFHNLKMLDAPHCKLSFIPDWIGSLNKLNNINLSNNSLIDLPLPLAQLEHLEKLNLNDNPLNPALQSAYKQGLDAVKAYLRSLEQNAEPLYEAKLVLVGEGNVGKTTLLKALKSEKGEGAPKKDERTTHGVEIDIHGLKLPHPEKDGVEIQLNAWDFGGQDVYRVTHQFFFSRRSLYLLVWEPRRGVQQCQVEDWLNMIRLRVGDDARVIIVSTYSKSGEHMARIDKPVFKQQYGEMIVGFHEVDSLTPDEKTGEMVGIAELKKVIAEESAKLEQMGMLFNNNWKSARDEVLALQEPRISFETFSRLCAAHTLSQIDTDTLAHLMHDLGYIVHYSDDEKLRDDVVLKPQWLTKAIGFVLENRATAEREGILPDDQLYKVWHDHAFADEPRYDSEFYPFFLRLMEKYDVCYRLPEGDASLVAQHVPQVRPSLPWQSEEEPKPNQRRLGMVCVMDDTPPGLVPWMIVRTHDYAYPVGAHSLHWQKGMFLRNDRHGEAMLELRGREFHMYAEAIWPEYFMNVLRQTLSKLIADNWPGLEGRYSFTVPCKNNECEGRFEIAALRDFLNDGDETIRCQKCRERQNIIELLYGFEDHPIEVQLREINQRLSGMDSRIANYFMATMRAIADEAKNGPRLFTFRSREAGLSPKQLFARPLELQLWCEAEGCQHPVIEKDKGIYIIDQPHEWVKQIAPYANTVFKILATVAPIAAPAIDLFFGRDKTKTLDIDRHLDFANAVLGQLPDELKASDRGMTPGKMLSEPERSGILALHRLLNELDPTQAKLGLHRVTTYTGDYRWLCQHHYEAWQPNIPDVIPFQK